MAEADRGWRRCNACKTPIGYGAQYYVCNVSTCNRTRTGMVFCDVSCWEVHLPTAHHREAWALERVAPSRAQAEAAQQTAAAAPAGGRAPRRVMVRGSQPKPQAKPGHATAEVLIVASRLKEYVRRSAGMNTSENVLGPLSDIVRAVCDQAVRNAAADGRRTVLERDIPER